MTEPIPLPTDEQIVAAFVRPDIGVAYRGYFGIAQHDRRSGLYRGRVFNLARDVITFQGASAPEVREAFEESVDDYLRFCAERGEEPEKPEVQS